MIKYGIIVGSTICTIKYTGLEGVKLLIIQPVNRRMKPIGIFEVAVDTVQAGVGDLCAFTKSHEASMTLENHDVPIDLATVGIIDDFYFAEDYDSPVYLKKGENKFT